jgi:hypothetical protein
VQAQEGTTAVRLAEKKIWTVGFHVQEGIRRSAQKRRLWTVGCSHRIPSVVGSGEDDQSLASGVSAQENGSRPSDLERIPISRQIETGVARGLPSGLQPSAYRESRGQKIETFQVSKHRRRSGPSVCGDRWQRSRESGYSASGNRSS